MNFRQLDLNLLRVLTAIHRTGSVTLAGKSLSLSQPATSNALARLRGFFADELFVRTPSGLKPTRLCEQLAPAVMTQLLALETLITGHEEFTPASSTMHWRLSLSDLGEMLFLPALAGAMRSQAPASRLSNISVASNDVAAALEAREIDMAVGILQAKHRGISSELLFREHYVAVAAKAWRACALCWRDPPGEACGAGGAWAAEVTWGAVAGSVVAGGDARLDSAGIAAVVAAAVVVLAVAVAACCRATSRRRRDSSSRYFW